eukprot:TRINITY_DN2064_c0_g4_i1.p1 TRINITY_DN2064_c0_g4~~TRINITY_DN2064_c0_g4_i1.p1  ORF type:complete len:660 (+),score=142.08 TRINITY_DN2064_c0_g4_i1:3-1982(+)
MEQMGDDEYEEGEEYRGDEEEEEEEGGGDEGEGEALEEMDPDLLFPNLKDHTTPLPDLLWASKDRELMKIAQQLWEQPDFPKVLIQGITGIPQYVRTNFMYVCLPQINEFGDLDGHNWIPEAVLRGASAIVTQRPIQHVQLPENIPVIAVEPCTPPAGHALAAAFFNHPTDTMNVIGIVGSHGKTTLSWLVRGILEEDGQLTGMINSMEYSIGPHLLNHEGGFWKPAEHDETRGRECAAPHMIVPYKGKYPNPLPTPEGIALQQLMSRFEDRQCTCVVIECDNSALAAGWLDEVQFNVITFTAMLGPNWQERMDSGESEFTDEEALYINNITGLFSSMVNNRIDRAVVNGDDRVSVPILEEVGCNGIPWLGYSLEDEEAPIYLQFVDYSIWETELQIRTPFGILEIITPLIGKQNAYNILAAVSTGIALRIPIETIGRGIESVESIPGRTEVIDEGQDFSVIVDAANTPDTLSNLLDDVRACKETSRILLVFGCEGMQYQENRAPMGAIANKKADIVILTNDSHRNEHPSTIIEGIVQGFPEDIRGRHPEAVIPWLQDVGNTPYWFQDIQRGYQSEVQRYVIEDRFTAIRVAIGTAQKGDVVIIAGLGARDYLEWGDIDDNIVKGWFDDRVEARNALAKLPYLQQIQYLNRKTLPWTGD